MSKPTDWRALCAELLDGIVFGRLDASTAVNPERLREVLDRAHTALSQTEPESAFTDLATRPLLEKVARMGDCIGQQTVGEIAAVSSQAAAWLDANPPGQPVAIEPRGCPTPGACSCVEPVAHPEPEGVRDDAELRTVFAIGAEARWREGFPESWSLTDMERAAHTAGLRAVFARKDRPQ